jgi:hypothetical protein
MKTILESLRTLLSSDSQNQARVDAHLRRLAGQASRTVLPPGLHERILHAVRRGDTPAAARPVRVRLAYALAFVAVLMLIGGLLVNQRNRPPQMPKQFAQAVNPLAGWETYAPQLASVPMARLVPPMEKEAALLAQDIAGAARFLGKCLAAQ